MNNPFLEQLYGQATETDDLEKMAQVAVIQKLAADEGQEFTDDELAQLANMDSDELEQAIGILAEGGDEEVETGEQGEETYSESAEEEGGEKISAADLLGIPEETLHQLNFTKESSVDLLMADYMGRQAAHEFLEKQAQAEEEEEKRKEEEEASKKGKKGGKAALLKALMKKKSSAFEALAIERANEILAEMQKTAEPEETEPSLDDYVQARAYQLLAENGYIESDE